MVGVGYQGLEDVDIFHILGLNPSDFPDFKLSDFLEPSPVRVQQVQQLKGAYKRLWVITHPDKAINRPDRKGDITKFQQLSQLNEFLLQFNTSCPSIWRRIAELFRRGKDGFRKPAPAYVPCSSGRGRGRGHVPRPTPASALAKPGSSPSNPIVIDALEICAPAVGSPNP